MKNLLCLVILLLVATVSFAQGINFFDVQGNQISKEQFEKQRDSRVNVALSFQKGKTTETRLFPRSEIGVISQERRNKIISSVQESTGKSISDTHLIIINYHQGKDACNSSGNRNKPEMKKYIANHRKKLSRLDNVSEYHLYATLDGLKDYYLLLDWYLDKNLLIENTFFKYKYPCKSFVIIRPDGKYGAYFGEYGSDQVIEMAKKIAD